MRIIGSLYERVLGKAESLLWKLQKNRVLDRGLVAQIHPDSLLFYYGNIHSQRGQDGILAEIFRRLGITRGYFVEFGAWDGLFLANCRYLYEKGWGGAFIEVDEKRFRKLRMRYTDSDVVCINSMVGAPKYGLQGPRLGDLLKKNDVDTSTVSFVSIDVDGPDLEIFFDIGFSPAVVLVEGGFNFAPRYDRRVPNEIAWANVQQPLAVIVAETLQEGYVPVCFYQDTFLVREDLAGPFTQLDALTLYRDAYYFMPTNYRKSLIYMRALSDVIRRLESDHFGIFSPDPLGY